MAKFTNCLQLVDKIDTRDQDALLARLDELQAQGMSPKEAQLRAAMDVLAGVEREAAGGVKRSAARGGATPSGLVVHEDLAKLGVTPKIVELFRKYMAASDVLGDDPYASTPAQKSAKTKAYRAMYAAVEKVGGNPSVAISAMHRIGDFYGPDALMSSPDVKRSAQRDATQTPEFKRWFGDSKVVDANGDPLVVYHGTIKDFDRFDISAERNMAAFRDAQGFYFTNDPRDASAYTEDRETGDPADGANIMPAYLRMENPLRVQAGDTDNHPAYISAARRKKLEEQGYDGIIYADGVEFVVLRPEQIKSATGNNGAFDPSDTNITRSATRTPAGVEIIEVEDGFDAMKDGKRIGRLRDNLPRGAAEKLGESANIDIVSVDPEFRGKGIGAALYQAFFDKHGGRVLPSGKTTKEAWAVWKRNYPEKVEAFVKSEAARIRDGADPFMVTRSITDPEVARQVSEAAGDVVIRSAKRPYGNAPAALMGFRRSAPNKPFEDQRYKHVEFVRVTWPDGRSILEAQRGLNKPHALERARRNWSDAEVEAISRDTVMAEDPSLVSEVDDGMSNVTRSASRQTDTPEFKAWFGDSKVVDADGRPMVVYHGTQADIDEFDPSKRPDRRKILSKLHDAISDMGLITPRGAFKESSLHALLFGNTLEKFERLYGGSLPPLDRLDVGGIFFTNNRLLAAEYAGASSATTGGLKSNGGANVIPAYIKIERPLVLEFVLAKPVLFKEDDGSVRPHARGASSASITLPSGERLVVEDDYVSNDWSSANRIAYAFAKKFDADGIIVKNVSDVPNLRKYNDNWSQGLSEADVYVAFDPRQIKSAIGNSGAFNPADANITRSLPRPQFYSQLQRAIEQVPDRLASMAAPQWKLWLDANAPKLGVKKDEVEWSGLPEFLKLRGKDKVTRDEIVAYLDESGVQVRDVVLGDGGRELTYEEWAKANYPDTYEKLMKAQQDGDAESFAFLNRTLSREWHAGMGRARFDGQAKYSQYTVPGGESYREVLITLPGKRSPVSFVAKPKFNPSASQAFAVYDESAQPGLTNHIRAFATMMDAEAYADELNAEAPTKPAGGDYRSSHWDQPNVLSHLRIDDRVDADGAKVLMLQEIQSDWGADGRKKGFAGKVKVSGFAWDDGKMDWVKVPDSAATTFGAENPNASSDNMYDTRAEAERKLSKVGLPRAPFVEDTKSWVALALKKAILIAVEGGHDKVAFISGEQAADLYDLSKRVEEIRYRPTGSGRYDITAFDTGMENVMIDEKSVPLSRVEDLVGKEIAQKVEAGDGRQSEDSGTGWRALTGVDLKVGGTGMLTFYNEIVPQVARDVLKKLGGGSLTTVDFASRFDLREQGGGWVVVDTKTGNFYRGDKASRPWGESGQAKIYLSESSAENAASDLDAGEPGAAGQPGFDITPAMREKVSAGMPLFSRNRDAASRLWREYATGDDGFKFGINKTGMKSKSLREVAEAFSGGGVEIVESKNPQFDGNYQISVDGDDESRTMLLRQIGDDRYKVSATDARPSADALAGGAGQRMYQTLLAFAANNGWRVDADFELSQVNKLRRTTALLSAALRAGSAEFIGELHPDQGIVGFYPGAYDDAIGALASAEERMVSQRIPLYDHITIDDAGRVLFDRSNPGVELASFIPGRRAGESVGVAASGNEPRGGGQEDRPARSGRSAANSQGAARPSDGDPQGNEDQRPGVSDLLGDGVARATLADSELVDYLASTRGGFASHGVGLNTLKRALVTKAALAGGAIKPQPGLLFSKSRPQSANEAYTEDLYGQPIEPAEPVVRRNAQRKPRVLDTEKPAGTYHINTIVAIARKQKLGAKRITTAAELAAATAHLRASPVERFDGVVTDAKGKPLAIVGSFKGAIAQAAVYPSTVIAEAVRVPGAAKIWFSHNHPSGTPVLSTADRRLEEVLRKAFEGTGIEPQGLIAVARDQFGFTDGNGDEQGSIPAIIDGPSVPVYEREFAPGDNSGMPAVSSPDAAKIIAKQSYNLNGGPGVILLDSQNRVSAVIPIDAEVGRKLRSTGGLNSIFRSVSQANAGAGIIFHGGEYDERITGGVTIAENIGAALGLVDLRVLDSINAKTGSSAAEVGDNIALGPVFSKSRTDTPEFKAWFGDSKVVDADGKPLVVYHGTGRDFSIFDAAAQSSHIPLPGFYFSPDPDIASGFAESAAKLDENRAGRAFLPIGANVVPAYLSLQNPAEIDASKTAHGGRMPSESAIEELLIGARKAGHDGAIIRGWSDGSGPVQYVAFRPEQIKSATGNNGNFDPNDADITRSVGRTATGAAWESPSASKFDDLVYKLQDKQIDLKRVVTAIKEAAGGIADDLNVYLKEELFHGRAAKRTEDFIDLELNPLIRDMAKDGLTMAEVEEYLHARHAEEANKVIAARNPGVQGLQDGGSGMLTADAKAYLASLSPAEEAKLKAAATKVDAIIAKTRQLYVDYELESADTVKAWGGMFKHYIPLMREDKDGSPGLGQGFSVKGREAKGRTGSTRKVVDVLANIALQRERAIVRGEKNRVSQALIGLAQANQNDDFWTVDEVPSERVFNPKTGLVETRYDPMWKSRENAVVAKIMDGNGFVREHAVVFNEEDERALRMAKAMKNLDAPDLEGLLGVSAKITRYFAAISTQYNPVFGAVNLVRDVQAALINLSSTALAGDQKKIAKYTASALAGIYGDLRAARKGKQGTSAWAALWDEFQEVGGQTGYRELFRTSSDRAQAIQDALDPTSWMDSKLGKVFTANGALKVPLAVAQKQAGFLFDFLSDYNDALENGTRLAAYKAGLERGLSKEQSASIAKNLTTSFNRKGSQGTQAGALYAFFNAAVQGTARIGQTIFDMDPGKPKTIRLSATGKKVVYGGVLLGSIQALMLAAAGFDDEDPPAFARERNLIIPTGNKTYISIPMPLGLHVIPNIGRLATEFALSGFRDPARRSIEAASIFIDAFNPIGSAGLSMQTLAPTALDPLVALTENKDWTGRQIARTSFNKATPGHALGRDTSTAFAEVASEAINYLSGGNKYVAGVFSPTPDQIDFLLTTLTGGVGREYSKTEQTLKSSIRGESLPIYKIPLVGRFIGNAKGQASESNSFYANINKLNELETEAKGLKEDGKNREAQDLLASNPESYLITQANYAERQIQRLRKQKSELIKGGAPRDSVKAIEEQITTTMARLNRAAEALRAKAEATE